MFDGVDCRRSPTKGRMGDVERGRGSLQGEFPCAFLSLAIGVDGGDDAPFGGGEGVEVIEELVDGGAAIGAVGVEVGGGAFEFDDGDGCGVIWVCGEVAEGAVYRADVGDVEFTFEVVFSVGGLVDGGIAEGVAEDVVEEVGVE